MTTQRKARGAYSVGQATRESILSAAMVLIAERGYNGFSLRDLGRRVGISHPAVVYHFPSKEAILRSAIQRHEEMNALFDVTINEEMEGGFDEGGITAGSFVDWAVGEMRFAMKPGADAASHWTVSCGRSPPLRRTLHTHTTSTAPSRWRKPSLR